MTRFLLSWLLFLSVLDPVFAAPDYAREKRWADEVTPAILIGDTVSLAQKNGHEFLAIYTGAAAAKAAVVVVHGIGVHPDWGLVGVLRQRLPDLGYATLSIQMPVLAADAPGAAYADTFPEAVERLQLAVAHLKSRGHHRIAVVSHSLGSQMSRTYMAGNPPEIQAWAAMGMSGAGGYRGIKVPVLDLLGANDLPAVVAGAAGRKTSLADNPRSRQVVVPAADHFFAGREADMVRTVREFLDATAAVAPARQ